MMHINKQAGLTLVEVLVTVIVTSIGVLGLAGLQGVSIKMSYDSYLRTQATFLARDLADRMLTNPDGDYTVTESEVAGMTAPTKSCASSVADHSCSISEMTNHDLYYWTNSAKIALPNIKLSVTAPGVGDRLHVINIKWNDQAGDGSEQTLSYTAQ